MKRKANDWFMEPEVTPSTIEIWHNRGGGGKLREHARKASIN